jgi:hypothetical protein
VEARALRRLVRTAAVFLLFAYALFSVYAAASAFWVPQGTFGLSTDYGSGIRAVAPGSPAALAGIVAGDLLLLKTVPLDERRYVSGAGSTVPPGTVVAFQIAHDGAPRDVRLKAVAYELTAAERSAVLVQCGASLVFIAVGTALILVRPSAATWGFGSYCLLALPTAPYPSWVASSGTSLFATGFYDVVQNLGVVGLLLFVLEFPKRFEVPWRRRVRRSLPALYVALVALTLYPDVANVLLGIGARIENYFLQLAFGATFALAIVILCDSYRRTALDERERLRWLLIGFGLGLMTSFIGTTLLFSSLLPLDAPLWVTDVLASLNVLLPLTVAHAVVRHRVFEINFVVGQTLVYATLTTLLAFLFGLFDWLFGYELEDFRLSRFLEAGISIGIAFAFDSLHKRVERIVETIFFRKRRAAEARLDRLVRELPQARSVSVVEAALVPEVIDAYELTSAALYLHDGNAFRRSSSYGWREGDCAALDDSDLLVLSLRAQKRSINLAELPWRHMGLPGNGVAPVVAVPMYSRADLSGIVLYGGHPGGGDVDPAELSQLERLAHAASVALDELEAEELRATNGLQAAALRQLEARLDELRRLIPEPRTQA